MAKGKFTQGVVVVAALVLLAALLVPRQRIEPPKPQQQVPDFSFTWQGETRRLSELRGRVVVLNFWATWCPSCVVELPALERLHRALGEKGVYVLGVSVDDDADAYEKFLRDNQLTFPTYRDAEKKIATYYGSYMFPETFIIDPQGRLMRKVVGAQEWDDREVIFFLSRLAEGTGNQLPR